MDQTSTNSGMSLFFELAAKTVMDVVRYMNRQPHGITNAGPTSPVSKASKKRRGRRNFLQRVLRTARRYAVEYIRLPAATNIVGFIKAATVKQPTQQTEKLQKLELELTRLRDEINRLIVNKPQEKQEEGSEKTEPITSSAPAVPPPLPMPQSARIPAPPPLPSSRGKRAAESAAAVECEATIVAPNMLTRRKLTATNAQSSASLTDLLTSGKPVALRKVEVNRSPGGTPMKDSARSDPTLYLALALKRKFKHMYNSPEEKRSPEPAQSGRRRRDSFFDDDEAGIEASPQTQPSRPVTVAAARAAPGIAAALGESNNTPTKPGSPAAVHRTRRQSGVIGSPQQVRRNQATPAAAAVVTPAPAASTPTFADKENKPDNSNTAEPVMQKNTESGVDHLPKMSVAELKKRLQSQNSGIFQKTATPVPSKRV